MIKISYPSLKRVSLLNGRFLLSPRCPLKRDFTVHEYKTSNSEHLVEWNQSGIRKIPLFGMIKILKKN